MKRTTGFRRSFDAFVNLVGVFWFVCFCIFFTLVVPYMYIKPWCFKYNTCNKLYAYRTSYDLPDLTSIHVRITEDYKWSLIFFFRIILIINSSVELNFQKYCTFIRLDHSYLCLYRLNASVYTCICTTSIWKKNHI